MIMTKLSVLVSISALLATGCSRSLASDSRCFLQPMPVAPSNEVFEDAQEAADLHTWPNAEPLAIDLARCTDGRWYASLPFGSAWVVVHSSDTECEVWLGGETENPEYDGRPTQYCLFGRDTCEAIAEVDFQEGGPAHIDSEACRDL